MESWAIKTESKGTLMSSITEITMPLSEVEMVLQMEIITKLLEVEMESSAHPMVFWGIKIQSLEIPTICKEILIFWR